MAPLSSDSGDQLPCEARFMCHFKYASALFPNTLHPTVHVEFLSDAAMGPRNVGR